MEGEEATVDQAATVSASSGNARPEVQRPEVQIPDVKRVKTGQLATADADRCTFFVLRKKRSCRMMVKPGKRFCGEHAHLEPEAAKEGQ
jgi:hypothetical protein